MEYPKCKHCGARHSLSEDHIYKDEPFKLEPKKREQVQVKIGKVETPALSFEQDNTLTANFGPAPESLKMMTLDEMSKARAGKHCPTCTCKGKRLHATRADKQRVYRQRKENKKRHNYDPADDNFCKICRKHEIDEIHFYPPVD